MPWFPFPPLSPNRCKGMIMHVFRNLLTRFHRDERGSVVAEMVITLPLLIWAYMAMYVYWDAFRMVNSVQKATYTVSDMVSREMLPINTAYIDGLRSSMNYLVREDTTVKMRVTSVTYSQINSRYEVHWSRSPGNVMPQLTNANLAAMTSKIPILADGDFVILIETWVTYTPLFDVGLDNTEMSQFIVTRPRFVPKICLIGMACT